MLLPKPGCAKSQSRDSSLIRKAQSLLLFLYFLLLHRARTLGLRSRFPKACSVEPWAQETSLGWPWAWAWAWYFGSLTQLWGHTRNRLLSPAEHSEAVAGQEHSGRLILSRNEPWEGQKRKETGLGKGEENRRGSRWPLRQEPICRRRRKPSGCVPGGWHRGAMAGRAQGGGHGGAAAQEPQMPTLLSPHPPTSHHAWNPTGGLQGRGAAV